MRLFICAAALATASVAATGCGVTTGKPVAQAPAGPAGGTVQAGPSGESTIRAGRTESDPAGTARAEEANPAGTARAGETPAETPVEVSPAQHRILLDQCRYADTPALRERCRSAAENDYRTGEENPSLDCRTYSGVSVCGVLPLSERERKCAETAAAGGLPSRRAEVECYVSP
ncbi:hypothetical protein GCM10010156_59430 [Planobispora rosea]|uniref:Secreted protein n=1 Tax=Planobispora rosea TaxID=35762 RepID=A0A8J3WFC3_PLARO|nr:hypothetical protein [Planobispora rosea]GGS93297.1 hypothetical protein GCM10010156_59430 [Planobispora rosea]GIH87245.1 hypothetical protein Pro02_56530 [Planobispora rosea]